MKRPKQKQSCSKHDRKKIIRVKCKVDSDDNIEVDGCSSDGTEDCSDNSNVSDDRELFCEDCRPRQRKKSSISSHSECSSVSERSSRHNKKKKGFSLFVVAADKTDCESGSESSHKIVVKRDKKKRKKSNDSCGSGSQKNSKDSKKCGSLKIKKIRTDSCDNISDPMQILRRFICNQSQMKDRKSKQSLVSKDCESLALESEDDCERGNSRRDSKKKSSKRGYSVPAKERRESRKEGSSKKKRSVSCSKDASGIKTRTKCCQTMSIEVFCKAKNSKYNKTRSKSCQTSKYDNAVYSFTQIRKPSSVYFMPPIQTPPNKAQTDCSEYFSAPATSQMDCPEIRHQDICVKDSQKPASDRTVNTLELHVDLSGSHKNRNCSKEKDIKSQSQSEENMKWCEKAFQDEFKNLVKKCEEIKPESLLTKGSSNKKCKSSKSKHKSQRKDGIEQEASLVLNAADLSVLAKMMHKLSVSKEPNC